MGQATNHRAADAQVRQVAVGQGVQFANCLAVDDAAGAVFLHVLDRSHQTTGKAKVGSGVVGVGVRLERIGLEAGPLSQWLFEGLAKAGLPAICIETRHARAFLKAQVNKTDRNDARGIAQMMRVNLYRPVHVKTLASQKHRTLLRSRKLLQEKALAIESDIRRLLRNFGLKVGIVGAGRFEARLRDLIEALPDLEEVFSILLAARRKLREAFSSCTARCWTLSGTTPSACA